MIPTRKNGEIINASWFQMIADAVYELAASFAIADGQAATSLAGQSFDGANISSVAFDYEVRLSTTIFASGRIYLQYLNGTWRVADGGYCGEDHGLAFSVTQTTTVGQLKVASTSTYGAGTLKIKRKSYEQA